MKYGTVRLTLPETNSLPLIIDTCKRTLLSGWLTFRGELLVLGSVYNMEPNNLYWFVDEFSLQGRMSFCVPCYFLYIYGIVEMLPLPVANDGS